MSGSRILACAIGVVACAGGSTIPGTPPGPERLPVGHDAYSGRQTSGAAPFVADQFEKERAEEFFVGRFPGVHVLRMAGGGLVISIRGGALLSPDRQPLYVIDGLAIQATPGRALDWLAPQDIETISVLKNAAETAMYGGRGANGVVLITTKRPRRPSWP